VGRFLRHSVQSLEAEYFWIIFTNTQPPVIVQCLKRTSHLWLAVVFTYMVRLQQFLAKMMPRK